MNPELLQGFYLRDWYVDPPKGALSRGENAEHLPPMAMEVLLRLASSPGELVTREKLLEDVWGVDKGSQEALNHAIAEVRRALGDDSSVPDFIQTLPRRGYRLLIEPALDTDHTESIVLGTRNAASIAKIGLFESLNRRGVFETGLAYLIVGWLLIQIADIVFDQLLLPRWAGTFVTVLVIAGFPIAIVLSWFLEFRDGHAVLEGQNLNGNLKRRFSRTYLSVIGALTIAAVVVFIYDQNIGLPEAPSSAAVADTSDIALPPIRRNSIAVLPFMNVDGTEQTTVFSNGLADDLITSLSRVPGLLVSSRGDSFTLDPNTSSSEVRKRLRVAMYVEGSVQIEEDSMRIIVQLIDSETGFHVVARSIDRPLRSFLSMRDEITAFTVANVRVALPPEAQRLPIPEQAASDLNAYVAYRRGKDLFEEPHTLELLEDVVHYYEQALAIDGEYAAAHAGRCAALVSRYELSTSSADIEQAEAACASALSSNPRLHMVHTALGDLYRRTNRPSEAKRSYADALEINPQDTAAMTGLARVLRRERQFAEAERLHKDAIEMQPGSWRNINSLGGFYFATGRPEEAANAYRQVVVLAPNNFQVRTNLGSALMLAGRFEEGSRAFEQSLDIDESDSAWSNLGVTYYYLGDFDNSVAANQKAVELIPEQPINWLNLADALFHADRAEESTAAYRESVKLAESRVEVDSSDFRSLRILGWASYMLGDAELGRDYIDRAVSIATTDPYGFYYRALIEVREGNHDEALSYIKRALENGYPVNLLAAEPYLSKLKGNDDFETLISNK